jgi:hypothetical protein
MTLEICRFLGRREQIDERQGSLHAAGGSPLRVVQPCSAWNRA